jgi:hypothetical protein
MNMIRKGQVRWLAMNDIAAQVVFVGRWQDDCSAYSET